MIRKAGCDDLCRIAEIYIFNNRINFYPVFKDETYSFGELQAVTLADNYFSKKEILQNISVYVSENGIIKGFIQMNGTEICKLYTEPVFQSEGIGGALLEHAVEEFNADYLWALEKNTRAISFYQRHGFSQTGERKLEEGTSEYLIKLERPSLPQELVMT